jgi:phosphoribosylglycinamide formyltransferase-1
MKNIVVLISGGGTNLQALLDAAAEGRLSARISGVISSTKHAYGLVRAEYAGIPTRVISRRAYPDAKDRDAAMLAALRELEADYVVLAGYMSILSPEIIGLYKNRIVNIHPSLIPSFCGKGFYGLHVHEKVLEYGAKVTGATVHFVDEGTDTGPIILQKAVPVLDDDTPEVLQQRVLRVEHELLPLAVSRLVEGRVRVEGRKVTMERMTD